MKIAELHNFADPRFVSDGFTLFVWGVYEVADGSPLPTFRPGFGAIVDVTGAEIPIETYARYNPETGLWADPLSDDAVPELMPFYTAHWDNERWSIEERPPEP